MNREWLLPAKVLTGVCALAVSSFSQTYTVSAKPGALNFIQGAVSLNGDPVWKTNLKSTFLTANDVLRVEDGKAEILLSPGAFLRVGDHSEVRMIRPSLVETQLEMVSGESMLEVDDMVPGSSIAIMDRGSVTTLTKPGLFRFTEHSVAALDGKADVAFGEHKVLLSKNKEVQISDTLHASKLDLNEPDELYAWSNVRAQYNAAASYAGSTSAYNSGGYGYSSYSSPGWYWTSGFNSYMWMPGNGAFYSPFGWGFYGPGLVAYAPLMYVPNNFVNGAYYPGGVVSGGGVPVKAPTAPVKTPLAQLTVPVNPKNVGSSLNAASPAALQSARIVNQNNANFYGLRTASGSTPAVIRGGETFSSMQAASRAGFASARAVAESHSSGGGGESGWSGGGSRSAVSLGSSGSGMSSMSHGSSGGGSGGHSK